MVSGLFNLEKYDPGEMKGNLALFAG